MKKILKFLFIFLFSLFLLCFLYLRFGAYIFLDSEIKKEVVAMIEDSPSLPERFYELYEVVYPNSLSTDLTSNLTKSLLGRDYYIHGVPSYQASSLSGYNYMPRMHVQYRYYIEDQTTQRECLNFVVSKMDFLYNTKGLREASIFCFEKEFEELDDQQMVTLIIMMKNPSLYNPIRRPEKVKEAVDKMMERLEETDNEKKSHTLMQLFNVL